MNLAKTKLRIKGMSLLEILVTVAIFSVLGVIVTRSVLLTLRGSKKSESQVKVRENINYSLAIIERQLRNANSIVVCPNPDSSRIDYKDTFGNATSFSCVSIGGADPYIASGSARLTNNEVKITSCSFVCAQGLTTNPVSVDVSIEAVDANAVGIEGAKVSATTKIFLRDY